jgi:hypothetical protein
MTSHKYMGTPPVYEKEKRKNEDAQPMLMVLIQALWQYLIVKPVQGAWWLTKQTARGSWWLAKNAFKTAWAVGDWSVHVPGHLLTWVWQLIMGVPPEFETQRERNIYRLHRLRVRRRNFFTAHTLVYALGMFLSGLSLVAIISSPYRYDSYYQNLNSIMVFIVMWSLVWAFHRSQKQAGDRDDRDLSEALGLDARQIQREKRAEYEAYYNERLAMQEYEPNDNHSAEHYEDDSGYVKARKP